jgi:recombination protein RecR
MMESGRRPADASDIERLIAVLAKLPGLGPRSARRAVLHLFTHRETALEPLLRTLTAAAHSVRSCSTCGNLDSRDPCAICADMRREGSLLCVVETVGDLWALERSGMYRGRYHVLGGRLSALDGIGPDDLRIPALVARARQPEIKELILATSVTVDGQITAHYIAERLAGTGLVISGLAHGIPIGGELEYLDDGTLVTALKARRSLA